MFKYIFWQIDFAKMCCFGCNSIFEEFHYGIFLRTKAEKNNGD